MLGAAGCLWLGLVGCSRAPGPPPAERLWLPLVAALPATATLAPPPTATLPATSTPLPTSTPPPRFTAAAAPGVPLELVAEAQAWAARHPADFGWGAAAPAVQLRLEDGRPLVSWVYAVAAPFATVIDEVTWAEVQQAWQTGGPLGEAGRLVLGAETAAALSVLLGPPHADTPIVPEAELVSRLWAARPAFTLQPFHRLEPRLKVLRLDGMSPLAADFAPADYPLTLRFGVAGRQAAVADFLALWDGPAGNRDPNQLTTVAMTGVTALVRATAFQMEVNGVLYPGTAVGPVLRAADVAHVSNEVAFAADCPYPNPVGGTSFCSRDAYFALLTDLGIDVVEVTGNHVNDWGRDNLVRTLDMYDAAGMLYFGGGRDLEAAAAPALITDHGNRLAFVGCNPVGPAYAWATATAAGSRPCDDAFYAQIAGLQADGVLVVATLQYQELYHYPPSAAQEAAFGQVAAAGAAAVSGSQGHHAQGFAFTAGAFVHYGLGNLFFDQMDMTGTRQAFVDQYAFYDGRLLSVSLWTGLIENYARPREMTPAERRQVLATVFQASGW